jgi:hypothetical protein
MGRELVPACSESWGAVAAWCPRQFTRALLLFILCACGGDEVRETELASKPGGQFRRTASALVDRPVSEPFGPPDLIARPLAMMVSGQYLFIADIEPPFVHVLDVTTGRHRRSFGLKGGGPEDFFSSPYPVAGSGRGDTVWFYQSQPGRLTGVAARDLSVDTIAPISTTRAVRSGWTFAIDGPDAAGNLLGLNQTSQGVESFTYALVGDRIIAQSLLRLDDKRLDPSLLGDAYQGVLCYVPTQDVWLQFYRNAGRADIIDANGSIRGEVSVPFRWLPHVEEDTKRPGQMTFNAFLPLTRHAYAACSVTDRFVYALYFGHANGDADVKQYLSRLPPAEVHVFDMTFTLVKTFALDHATEVLTVLPGDTVLFSAINDSTGVQVRRTRIR